ncbi:hypothetical protein DFJ73DRAFT_661112 [Zopfochytrium polystomum]|nr:hypothetical protein DFJ73DRAFT_661112 [Zopfochytrium polystomum]
MASTTATESQTPQDANAPPHPLYVFLHNLPYQYTSISHAALAVPLPADIEASVTNAVDGYLAGTEASFQVFSPDPTFALDSSDDLPAEYQANRRGKPCGHVFQAGETIYSCKTCGLDETCVMCARCFRSTNHVGHTTSFHLSRGDGGCCDCGDVEAWKVPLLCQYHAPAPDEIGADRPTQSFMPIPPNLTESMRLTIGVVLDYIVDTFSGSPIKFDIPPSAAAIKQSNPPEKNASGLIMDEKPLYACVLWNDEEHTFEEVIGKLEKALRCDRAAAAHFAETVDAVGRCVIQTDVFCHRLLSTALIINERSPTGLTLTIRTFRETFRENIAGYLVGWLKDLQKRLKGSQVVNGVRYESLATTVRRIVCEELLAPRQRLKLGLVSSPPPESVTYAEQSVNPDGHVVGSMSRLEYLLVFDGRLWKNLRTSLKELFISTLVISGDDFKKALGERFSRVYSLLAHSFLHLDREPDLSIIKFSVQLFTVPTISQYLFTNSSILPAITSILKSLFLAEVYPTLLGGDFFESLKVAAENFRPTYAKLPCETDSIYKKLLPRYPHLFHDLRYILSTYHIRSDLFRGDLTNFAQFLDLCLVFQGMNRQKRQARYHVEYEPQGWINSFHISSSLSRLIDPVRDAFAPVRRSNLYTDYLALLRAIRMTLGVLDHWCAHEQCMEFNQRQPSSDASGTEAQGSASGFVEVTFASSMHRVIDYPVHRRSISLHHPVHWVLSALLSCIPQYLSEMAKEGVTQECNLQAVLSTMDDVPTLMGRLSNQIFPLTTNTLPTASLPMAESPPLAIRQPSSSDQISRMLDHLLRVEVALSQIRGSLWIRNGQMIRHQATAFKHTFLRDLYDLNLFLIQSFSVLLSPDHFLAAIIEKFELRPFFSSQSGPSMLSHPFDLSVQTELAEDFVQFLITVIAERGVICNLSVEDHIRREIIHLLAGSPNGLPHSKLADSIPERFVRLAQGLPHPPSDNDYLMSTSSKSVDAILREVSNFKFPEGSSDKGLYELKAEFYELVDPWFYHLTKTQREDIETVLRQREENQLKETKSQSALEVLQSISDNRLSIDRIRSKFLRSSRALVASSRDGPWANLSAIIDSDGFSKVIFFGLLQLCRKDLTIRSDALLSGFSQLLLLGVAIALQSQSTFPSVGARFLENLCIVQAEVMPELGVRAITLIDLVLEILDRRNEDFAREGAEKLATVAVLLSDMSGCQAAEFIHAWRSRKSGTIDGQGDAQTDESVDADEAEKKKLASKQRKAAIMAQFAKQQLSFMESMGDLNDEDDDMDVTVEEQLNPKFSDERRPEIPGGTCIICQEPLSIDGSPYGMVTLLQQSRVSQRLALDPRNMSSMKSLLWKQCSLDIPQERPVIFETDLNIIDQAEPIVSPSLDFPPFPSAVHASSCGHLMHFSCFDSYKASIERRQGQEFRNQPENLESNEFLCPLCKSLGNTLAPIQDNAKFQRINWSGCDALVAKAMISPGRAFGKSNMDGVSSWLEGRASALISAEFERPEITSDLEEARQADDLVAFLKQVHAGPMPLVLSETFPHAVEDDDSVKRLSTMLARILYESDNLKSFTSTCATSLAASISSTEKLLRGAGPKNDAERDADGTINILESVNPTTLSFLALYSSDIRSAIHVVRQRMPVSASCFDANRKLLQSLFTAPHAADMKNPFAEAVDPILRHDPFTVLVELSFGEDWTSFRFEEEDIFHLIGVVWVLQITRVVTFWIESIISGDSWTSDASLQGLCESPSYLESLEGRSGDGDPKGKKPQNSDGSSSSSHGNLIHFLRWILPHLRLPEESHYKAIYDNRALLETLTKAMCLPFLRNVTLLLHCHFGLVPPTGSAGFGLDPDLSGRSGFRVDEFGQLLGYTRLPPLDTVCANILSDNVLSSLVGKWLVDFLKFRELHPQPRAITLEAPLIPELVTLPKSLEALFADCFPKTCQKCKKRILEPGLCLLCGKLLCANSYCCANADGLHECNQHIRDCGGSVGIFFLVKQFRILLLHNEKGTLMDPPYLDAHGEVDISMRKGRHQFLHSRRYDELRRIWLTHGIPSHVARALESNPSFGGWTIF